MRQDERLVDRIVAGVMARLEPARTNGQSAPQIQKTNDTSDIGTHPVSIVWNENVITGESVIERLKGEQFQSRVLRIGQRTVLTPSAVDELRARGVRWERVTGHPDRTDSATRPTWKMILQQAGPHVKTVLEELKSSGSVKWTQEIAGTLKEAIVMAVTPLARAEIAGAIMWTDKPHAAACLANRHDVLRAAVVREISEIESLQRELGPNLYCLAGGDWNRFTLRKAVLACVNDGSPSPPSGWKV